ncbi:Ig-like domain-containing protein [Phytoactinopolyspora limicola]|uniref:Ig-like domain-containing protein n=1 Tax=Phytoactinopolyspora limicola TaxID=2715536 RepID=UPI00140D21CF|nr:Ig-like domain-containing protein [Phytoactinopolyspora limicola]
MAVSGAGALALGVAALPAVGLETRPAQEGPAAAATSFAEPNSSGPETLSQLSSADLKTVAARVGLSADRLEAYLKADQAFVTPSGGVVFVDDFDVPSTTPSGTIDVASVPGDPVGGSRPDAPQTVFLEFDGAVIEGSEWNRAYDVDRIDVSAYNVDDDFKAQVWAGVAQHFAPFNVNVTISDPGADALFKTSPDDNNFGTRVLIVGDQDELPEGMRNVGGRAFLGWFGVEYADPAAYVLADVIGDNPTWIASVASHEAGHNFGLEHHGIDGNEYYYNPTPASPEALWGPIMGAPYTVPMSSWSHGDYAMATNPDQDDLATITDRSLDYSFFFLFDQNGDPYDGGFCPYRDGDVIQDGEYQYGDEFFEPVDDSCAWEQSDHDGAPLDARWNFSDRTDAAADPHGDSIGDATVLDNASGEFAADGLIIDRDDVDVFAFVTAGGAFSAEVAPVTEAHAVIDLKLSLLDADGNVLAENEQETTVDPTGYPHDPRAFGLEASLADDLELGVYYLQVEGRGEGDPSQNTAENGSGYSDYGSIGNYELTGTADALDVDPVVITSPEDGAEVEPAGLEVTGTAEAEASVTLTVDGETVGTADVDAEGGWSTTLDGELAEGESTITARQTIESFTHPQTDSVTVVVAGDPGDENGGAEDGSDDGAEDGTEDGTDDGAEDGTEDGSDDGADNGTDNGGDEGADNGTEDGDDDGGELPDTGAGSMIAVAVGLALLALGGAMYARTRRATV